MIRALLPIAALFLSACSMEAVSEKRVPADVRADVNAKIDRLVAGDTQFILDAFPDDSGNPDLAAQIEQMRTNVPDAPELSRHVVGVMGSTQQAYSDTQGSVRTGTYNLAHELEFEDGYLLVQTATTLDADGTCCVLRAINATRFAASPQYEDQQRRGRLFRWLALFLVVSTLATLVALVIRIGGRKARATRMGGR
ncbi:hypothetical protein [uncultured Algimonas sp.]|uniref:hypothetical protein n=1 Tax=uncultured Algimonas sp. TaxID=1547920 RepID=UPI00262837A3|nr:hypothetical protein [uncultured Algimonas sp.]